MHTSSNEPHPKHSRAMTDEADIGSGEKTPGQIETDKMIQEIPAQATAGPGGSDVERAPRQPGGKEAEQDSASSAGQASERDKAGHGQVQREQNASRQDAGTDMTPDAAV